MADPANVLAVDDIALMTGYEVRPAVASREDIAALVAPPDAPRRRRPVGQRRGGGGERRRGRRPARVRRRRAGHQARQPDHRPGRRAGRLRHPPSSPTASELRVRFRIDGVLHGLGDRARGAWSPASISRVKIMSDLDIAERRVPQDGRVGLTHRRPPRRPARRDAAQRPRRVDRHAHPRQVRAASLELDKLGMADDERERFEQAFRQAYGAVLVTGPTGSGKSTSLYAALGELNTPEKNIITIEDPVEYQLEGITQVQVNPQAGPDLRQRPARDDARRPRHHHGRRDPRPRDGADRHRGARSPATSSSPRCTPTTRRAPITPPDRDGHRAVPRRQRARLRRRPAPGAHAVPALQAAHDPLRRGPARPRLPRRTSTSRPTSPSAARAAAARATRAASASTRS